MGKAQTNEENEGWLLALVVGCSNNMQDSL